MDFRISPVHPISTSMRFPPKQQESNQKKKKDEPSFKEQIEKAVKKRSY